jgi:hypothetical protein
MKDSNTIVLIILLLLILYGGCKKPTDSAVTLPKDQNLILNSSFESASGPSIDGWIFRDSSIYAFSPDAPTAGGHYSVVLRTAWRGLFSFNSVMTRVGLQAGTHRYKLSCWAKRLAHGAGSLSLLVGPGDIDTMTASVRIPIVDSVWTFYSAEIILANQASDSAVVALHGGNFPIQYLDDSSFFDLCKFERLD